MTSISCGVNSREYLVGSSRLLATAIVNHGLPTRLSSIAKITPRESIYRNSSVSLAGSSRLLANENMNFAPSEELGQSAVGNIKGYSTAIYGVNSRLLSSSNFYNKFVDKFAGYKPNFKASSKLYPIDDISFKNKITDANIIIADPAYSDIDEGVFAGNYTDNNSTGSLISDDNKSIIFPNYVFSSGDLEYKFRITYPFENPRLSYFAIRASAPFDSYIHRVPQEYKIYDIKLEDPSGNLIIQYDDININGDNNFSTYISKPLINNVNKPTWESGFPYMDSGSPLFLENQSYTLSLSLTYICNQRPFDSQFNFGYEYTCVSGIYTNVDAPNLFDGLKISAIEIGNSGCVGILKNNYLNFYSQVRDKSERISRTLLPHILFTNTYNNGIYPESNSIWKTLTDDTQYTNLTESGSVHLLQKIRSDKRSEFITLSYTTPFQDSGRLILKFNTNPERDSSDKYVNGAFAFGGNADFDNASLTNVPFSDHFFDVDSIELKVIARKHSSNPDYSIDVVGYSDDTLLNVTSPVGGFLQNSGSLIFDSNNVPNVSGFSFNTFGLSSTSLSDQSEYYNRDTSRLGDHYIVNDSILVNSTSFQEYTIPLNIYQNPNDLGFTKYSISSFFEHLYLDICPIPSGASIANIRMVINYKPSNGLMMHTLGSPENKSAVNKRIKLLPSPNIGGNQINTNIPLSGILNGLTTPNYIKSNYSRRWRGVDGHVLAGGDFNPLSFDYSFNHKPALTPFLSSYVNFHNTDGIDIFDTSENYVGQAGSNFDVLENFGWRYSSDQLFNDITTDYKSLAWKNNIFDAFDRAIRISSTNQLEMYVIDNDSFDDYGNPNNPLGFALFLRFTPDKVSTDDLNNCIIFTYENATKYSLALICENGTLKLKIRKDDDTITTISDSILISQYQFPLSVLITYNDDGTYRYKLYTDNELTISFNNLRASSSPIATYILSGSPSLRMGYSQVYNDQDPLPMFLHEVASSNGRCNIKESSNINKFLKETNARSFFDSHRMHFNNLSITNVRSDQYSYIDDDIDLWNLGAFKVCHFSPDFDFFKKRNGNDFLSFHLNHSGSGYNTYTDLTLPSNINLSGVAYHTQIENDFLRFNLSNIPSIDQNRFYAVAPRICKTLPKGYQFNDDAICVDTIVEHDTFNDIVWDDGQIGPKLIVSLYTKNQESIDRPSKLFGLVNRTIHHLEPSGCIRKLTSTFTYDSLFDNSEPWATFDRESYSKEFKEKYFSKDIDDMFLQYDLVYPSGKPINSIVKIHSANVRLEEALFISETSTTQLNLLTSGRQYQVSNLNLFIPENGPIIQSGINLYVDGNGPVSSNLPMHLFSSGFYAAPGLLNLYNVTIGSASTENNFGEFFGSSPLRGLNLYVSGQLMRETYLPLYVSPAIYPSSGNLILYSHAPESNTGLVDNNLILRVKGITASYNVYPSSTMPLFVHGSGSVDSVNNSTLLYINGYEPTLAYESGSLSLTTLNYPISASLANRSAAINWNNSNVGFNIVAQDNQYAYVDSDDNIRGVDIICYGSCSSANNNRCSEAVIDIHGIKWYYPDYCIDGGIFRAKNTYTNLSYPSGSFRHTTDEGVDYDPMPYSGHFYGIRKYTGLAPNTPYVVNITGKSGSSEAIDIPTEIIEVEYNQNETDEEEINHDGFRILADNIYQNSGDKFGKSISSKDDLLAIGAPFRSVSYDSGVGPPLTLSEAGTVFLYRRNPRPSGYEWPLDNYKSSWVLEEALTLPSGLLKDYSKSEEVEYPNFPFRPIKTTWYVGQEGRQFGHSVDLAINKDKKSIGENSQQTLVVGGPSAKWTPREFDDGNPSGINIGLMILTDEFQHEIITVRNKSVYILSYRDILESIADKDLLFRYFSSPQIKFDLRMMICPPKANNKNLSPTYFPDKPDFIALRDISRNIGYPISRDTIDNTVSGLKATFFEAFPYDTGKLNNNIPPVLGICIDDSVSLGRESLEPAIDEFINFYKSYSFASGLVDSFGVRSSGLVVEYLSDGDANWIEMSKSLLSEVLDTGKMIQEDRFRFFTNKVGIFNTNLSEFNFPPESGGKAYIFEKESGSWNLIQEIRSDNVTYYHPDRFGHAVSISDDGEVVVVGSPYTTQAVNIYERKDDQRDLYYSLLADWVQNNYYSKYKQAVDKYRGRPSTQAAHELYLQLDPEHKFQSRVDLNIQEYQKIHTFGYESMQPVGSWTFIPQEFAPTSRLGYSVDTNEDGSIVVAGAPTDSLNFYNDADVYHVKGDRYKTTYSDPSGLIPADVDPAWSATVNAGSVHVFQSRKYFPHNKVVEIGRFGNLHELSSNNTLDSGHFGYLAQIFDDKNFSKTEFTDSTIPSDAGLAFIITPSADAISISNEVFDNITRWLSLGDRNLVLVANDPIWERNGLYSKSNDILNKLLERLQSRMRIVPARNRYESLPNGYTDFNNVIPSMIPQGATPTFTNRLPVRASGVADIKIYFQYEEERMPCEELVLCEPDSEPVQLQTRCEMPLKNYGDLRAGWNDYCCKPTARGFVPIIYKKNWPFIFGSFVPDCGDPPPPKPTKNQEPIPLLAAAEKVVEEIVYPEIPAQFVRERKYNIIYENTTYYELGDQENEDVVFAWSADQNMYDDLQYNITNNLSPELFFTPDEGGILQARAISKVDITPYVSKKEVSDKTYFAVEEQYPRQNTSSVTVLASTFTESESCLYVEDTNINFYINLISKSKTQRATSKIAQLGGWTNRTSFTDGYDKSILKAIFENNDNNVIENVQVETLDGSYNVAWVAAIMSQPNDYELLLLKNWLNIGNNKLIITCDGSLASVQHAQVLCDKLGVNIKPVYLTHLNKYQQSTIYFFNINRDHQTGGRFFNRNKYRIDDFYVPFRTPIVCYPLAVPENGIGFAFSDEPIYDEIPEENIETLWNINAGIVKLTVPTQAGSGYKLFITTAADTPSEIAPLEFNIGQAAIYPSFPAQGANGSFSIPELNSDGQLYDSLPITTTFFGEKSQSTVTKTIKFQNASNESFNEIYISCASPRVYKGTDIVPRSVKLVGISGVMIPILTKITSNPISIPTDEFDLVQVSDKQEERREYIDVIRPISTDNTKYCTDRCMFLGNQLIDDGPIVAAQEIEILSPFDAGYARSRITVITDSSIIQGRYVVGENGVIPRETYSFIRSLYPETNFRSDNSGRQFNVYNKLISPERGSPSKYYLNAPLSGIHSNFGGSGSASYSLINKYESQYDPQYIKRPDLPWKDEKDEKIIARIRNEYISGFYYEQFNHASTARFSGIIDGVKYTDASVGGGLPQLLKDKGYDYLDFDHVISGYPGDLFGYSVCVRKDSILIGSPFSAFSTEDINPWHSGVNLHLGNDGGGGSVYMFERSGNLSWSCRRKFKPQSLMGQLSGVNSYSDQFGHSIDVQYDTIIIGAPNHKFDTLYDVTFNDGAFARKNFNNQFDVPIRNAFDLGISVNRENFEVDGVYADKAGAIYLYENKIINWENKTRSWSLVEKFLSQSPQPNGERFGKNLYLSRPYRSDADYTVFAGVDNASGNNILNIGATYAKDIMLKGQNPSLPSSGSWINARLFGTRDIYGEPTIVLNFSNSGDNKSYFASGIIIPNNRGEIFLEVSGQDPSTRGFIKHRPYIESVLGYYQYGILLDTGMILYIDGKNIPPSSQLPLIMNAENSAYVYNTIGLYNGGVSGVTDSLPSGLYLFNQSESGISLSSSLTLTTSGTWNSSDALNLRVRGK